MDSTIPKIGTMTQVKWWLLKMLIDDFIQPDFQAVTIDSVVLNEKDSSNDYVEISLQIPFIDVDISKEFKRLLTLEKL